MRPPRPRGYRSAVITDARGRTLLYADRCAIHPAPSGGGAVGLGGVTFAPGVLERLTRRLPRARVVSRGTPCVELFGLRVAFHAGARRLPEGGWSCDAAVGTCRRVLLPRVEGSPRDAPRRDPRPSRPDRPRDCG